MGILDSLILYNVDAFLTDAQKLLDFLGENLGTIFVLIIFLIIIISSIFN